MTSSPLFIIEAESMVIFWPMLQFGCFSACASVACSMSARRPGAERAAGCGDDHAHQFLAIAGGKRLKQRVMFGIRRQDAGACFRRALHEEIAGADQAFLVGQRHRRAAIDGGQCRLQPGRAAHRRHHPVGGTRGGLDDSAFAGAAFGACAGQRGLQFAKARGIGDRRESRAEFLGEFGQRLDIGIRGQRLDLSSGRARRAANPWCCRRWNRWRPAPSRCARLPAGALLLRNGTALIISPNHKTAADAIGAAPQKPEKCRHDDGCDKSIQAIH